MVKCDVKNSGSVVLDRPFKIWSLILASIRCGGGGCGDIESHSRQKNGSEKLSEILKQPELWDSTEDEEEELRKKEVVLEGLKKVAKKLQQQEGENGAAAEVRKLTKDDAKARVTLAMLGVIPPLVALLDHHPTSIHSQIIDALYALLNLAIANDANKSAIVKSGAVHKMLMLVQSPPPPSDKAAIGEAVVANFLGLSALDSNKPIIGSSGAIPFLVETLQDTNASCLAKHDSLRALFNLSISPLNLSAVLDTDLLPWLFINLGDMDVSEIILSILGNLVSSGEGRKRISSVCDSFPILIDVLNWSDSPNCQEKASYILMVMAHKSYGYRQAMIESRIVSSLLELTLMGSSLAQKRASRMLECLRMDKGKQVDITLSAPLLITSLEDDRAKELEEDEMMSKEKKAVNQLVQQSLHSNMKRMVNRANFETSHHSISKSLPF